MEEGKGSPSASLPREHVSAGRFCSRNGPEEPDPARYLPLADPDEAACASLILQRIGGAAAWRVEEALRPMLLSFDAEGTVGGVLEVIERDVLPRWAAGKIKQPIAYLRKILRDSGDDDGRRFGVFHGAIECDYTECSEPTPECSPPAITRPVGQHDRDAEPQRGCAAESIVHLAVASPQTAPPLSPVSEGPPQTAEKAAEEAIEAQQLKRQAAEQRAAELRAAAERGERGRLRAECQPVLCELEGLAIGRPERIRAIREIVYPHGLGTAVYEASTAKRLRDLTAQFRAGPGSELPMAVQDERTGADVSRSVS